MTRIDNQCLNIKFKQNCLIGTNIAKCKWPCSSLCTSQSFPALLSFPLAHRSGRPPFRQISLQLGKTVWSQMFIKYMVGLIGWPSGTEMLGTVWKRVGIYKNTWQGNRGTVCLSSSITGQLQQIRSSKEPPPAEIVSYWTVTQASHEKSRNILSVASVPIFAFLLIKHTAATLTSWANDQMLEWTVLLHWIFLNLDVFSNTLLCPV